MGNLAQAVLVATLSRTHGTDYAICMINPPPEPDALSDLIGLVYESAMGEPQWQALIDRVAHLFPGVSAQVVPYEGETFLPAFARSRNTPVVPGGAEFDRARLPRRLSDQPTSFASPGYVSRTTEAFAEEDWLRTDVYRTFLAPAGCRHVISVNLGIIGAQGVLLTFPIPEDPEAHAVIHDPLHDLLCRLAPHMVRASRIASDVNAAQRIAAGAGSVLDTLAVPIIVADGSATVLFANVAGRRILETGELLRLTSSHRIAASGGHGDVLAVGLRQASETGLPAAMQLEASGASVSCCIVPLRTPGDRPRPSPHRANPTDRLVAIYVGETAPDPIAPGLLEHAFGLTSREAEICSALANGQGPQEIADNASRSLKTVRNQIHAIHGKIGVSSSQELASALAVFRVASGTIRSGQAGKEVLPDQER